MTDNKKNSHNNEWNGDHQYDTEAHPNGVVHSIIMHKNNWAKPKANYHEDNTANIFPFPRNNK